MTQKVISTSERRFNDGSGERYLSTDPNRVRCQAVSKTKLRLARILQGNPDLDSNDVWPEGQCQKGAEEGTFLCHLHGGLNPNINKKRVSDYMPLDLRQKYQIFEAHPDLLSRYSEMAQLQARNAQLYERLEEFVIGQDAWQAINDGVQWIERGETVKGVALIRIALHDTRDEKATWQEIRLNDDLISKLHNIQIATEEKLKTMATIDQVKAIVNGAFQALRYILEAEIEDRGKIGRILTLWAGDLTRLVGAKRVSGILDEPR